MITCPNCNGEKTLECFADRHNADGSRFGYIKTLPCSTCVGVGHISSEHAKRIETGREKRKARLAAGLSLMEAATIAGISPAELSAIESGRKPEPETQEER